MCVYDCVSFSTTYRTTNYVESSCTRHITAIMANMEIQHIIYILNSAPKTLSELACPWKVVVMLTTTTPNPYTTKNIG